MSKAPVLTPVEVNLLTGADEQAQMRRAALLDVIERAGSALQFDMLPLVRGRLTQALRELDALEVRLTELRAER